MSDDSGLRARKSSAKGRSGLAGGGKTLGSSAARTAFKFIDLRPSPNLQKVARDFVQLRALKKFIGLGPFFAANGVSVQTQERLKTILVEGEFSALDFETAARNQGFTGSEPEMQAALQQFPAQTASEIENALGPELFQHYQAFNAAANQRPTVNSLADELCFTSKPLTASQADQLSQVLSVSAAADNAAPALSDATITRAQKFLSPPQVAALRQLQEVQRLQADRNAAQNAAAAGGKTVDNTPLK